MDLLCVCGNSYSGTSILTTSCRKYANWIIIIDSEVINGIGPLTITVDFLKIETVL